MKFAGKKVVLLLAPTNMPIEGEAGPIRCRVWAETLAPTLTTTADHGFRA